MQTIYQLGIELILFLQGLGSWLVPPMLFFTSFGEETFFLVVVPLLYWSVDMGLGLRVGFAFLISGGLNLVCKLVFHAPRPFWFDARVVPLRAETTFGIPSGHAQNTAAIWLAGATWVKKPWFWALALGIIWMVGLSRLVLGMHFPTDVLAGWLIGALLVWAVVKLEKPVVTWVRRQTLTRQLLLAPACSLVILALAVAVRLALGDWQVPAAWVETARLANRSGDPAFSIVDPLSISHLISTAGTLLGLLVGLFLLPGWGGFRIDGPAWQRALRTLVGMVGLLLIWYVLGAILPRGEYLAAYLFRYLRYTLMGLWVALAPLLFRRLGLAGGSQPPISTTRAS